MLVLHVISNLGSGGAEASLYQLVKHNQSDQQIVVSMRDKGVYADKLSALGVEVHTLDMPRGSLSFSGLKKLYSLIRRAKPDVIQTWMYHADLIGGLVARFALNNRVCWGIHHSNLSRSANSTALVYIVKLCALSSWVVPKKIISCSQRSMEVHSKARYRKSIFTVIPNGYDLQRFVFLEQSRETFRTSLGVGDECLLGLVGRWHPQKDHANLIQAVALYNQHASTPLRCVLIGSGLDENNAELMHELDRFDARSYFILHGATDDVPAAMSGIDVHVLSSKGEAFPNVVSEAMACKTPCVVTDVGDAALIVGDSGWVVAPENSEALADGIAKAVAAKENDQAWRQRCINCRERIVGEYEISQIVKRYRAQWQFVAKSTN